MTNVLTGLQDWFLKQCDGQWEHAHGLTIGTLDNPGWAVEIDLKDTRWERVSFDELKLERGSDDWATCSKNGPKFKGYGDPGKLALILNHFLAQVASTAGESAPS